MTIAEQLGAKLRMLRESRGLTLTDIPAASQGRFTAGAAGFWERGERDPGVERLEEYAQFLGANLRDLWPAEQPRSAVQMLVADTARRASDDLAQALGAFGDVTPGQARQLLIAALTAA